MDSDPIIPDVTDVIPPAAVERPWLFQKGRSGNVNNVRPTRKSLKQLAQEVPERDLAAFVRHVYASAIESSSATSARWAQLFADLLGESGASFRVAIEASGWTSFQSEVMAALLAAAPPEPAPPEIRTGPDFPPFPPS